MDPLRRVVTSTDVGKLLAAIEKLRVLDLEMPAQVISAFLYVASHDGCHSLALKEDLDMTAASTSRNTDWLSGTHRSNPERGLNLITKEVDPSNRRRHILKLTPQGKKLAKDLLDIIYGETIYLG